MKKSSFILLLWSASAFLASCLEKVSSEDKAYDVCTGSYSKEEITSYKNDLIRKPIYEKKYPERATFTLNEFNSKDIWFVEHRVSGPFAGGTYYSDFISNLSYSFGYTDALTRCPLHDRPANRSEISPDKMAQLVGAIQNYLPKICKDNDPFESCHYRLVFRNQTQFTFSCHDPCTPIQAE